LADFLLIFEDIPCYTKNDIDIGSTPPEIYRLCSCIREAFCFSYSIRKENNLYILLQKNLTLIKFQGNELRFLGSDERSQAILFNKAISKTFETNNSNRWIKSTAGIFIKKIKNQGELLNFIESISFNKIIILNKHIKEQTFLTIEELKDLRDLKQYLFILPNFHRGSKVTNNLSSIKKLNNLKFVMLSKVNNIENKILYINFIIDQQNRSSN
jgi:tRNA pseudouridine-54 N-methylase